MPPEGGCMRAHSSLRLGTLRGRLLSFWSHRGIALGAFVWFGKRDSPTRRPLLPRNAGTAEPVRVSPPEAVAYPLELGQPRVGQHCDIGAIEFQPTDTTPPTISIAATPQTLWPPNGKLVPVLV